jgi:Uma2 family endonuclease
MPLVIGTVEKTAASDLERTPRRWTYEQLCTELPETNQPAELWDGQLIMPPARSFYHQKIVLRFYRQLHDWVMPRKLGEVIAAPVDMVLSPHRAVQPDVAFIAHERLAIIQDAIMGPADLVAEVLSLGGRSRDRIEKRDLYEQHGVNEYWLIDPESETVEVLALVKGRYQMAHRGHRTEPAPSRLLPGFQIDLPYLFHGE